MGTSHRVIETPVYYFDQLSDSAKEKARDWWRQCEAEDPSWGAERRQSLEAFCNEFPVEARSWEYDSTSYSIHKVWTADPDAGRIKGSRLIGFMLNEYGPRVLWKPKEYEKNGKKRRSKVLVEETDCPFTGYCADEDLLDPIRQYLKEPDMELTYVQLMGKCLDAWGKACVEDMAWLNSAAQVEDTIIVNEYEFDEEGNKV